MNEEVAKRWADEDEGLRVVTPCATCRHRDPEDGRLCAAFPDGIPLQILQGEHNHQEPFPGDHGILWAAK